MVTETFTCIVLLIDDIIHVRDAGLWIVSAQGLNHGRSNKDIPTTFSYTLLSIFLFLFLFLFLNVLSRSPFVLPRQSRWRKGRCTSTINDTSQPARPRVHSRTPPPPDQTTVRAAYRHANTRLPANDIVKIAAAQVASRPSLHLQT